MKFVFFLFFSVTLFAKCTLNTDSLNSKFISVAEPFYNAYNSSMKLEEYLNSVYRKGDLTTRVNVNKVVTLYSEIIDKKSPPSDATRKITLENIRSYMEDSVMSQNGITALIKYANMTHKKNENKISHLIKSIYQMGTKDEAGCFDIRRAIPQKYMKFYKGE